jgi:2-polyprenyl-3-methyl-5-hydroxy-6-metoxy-1,4-benzoquinol methylase
LGVSNEKRCKNEFDFFIFSQTLEHLYNPFEAVKQIYEIVKPGGYVFTSVPTLNIPHMIHINGRGMINYIKIMM